MTTRRALAVLLLGVALASTRAAHALPAESFWGARELHTRHGRLRYLLLFPPGYDPRRTYELWVNLHGSPGCASHAIYQYRLEAARRHVLLLAPQAVGDTGDTGNRYVRPDGRHDTYRFWNMQREPASVLVVLDEVLADYPIDRGRVALLGFSAGCEMGWRLLAARPTAFYFFGGVANRFRRGKPPVSAQALGRAARHTPHFYAAGRDDGFAGPMFRTTARKLRELGFELRTAYPAGVGHDLPPSIEVPLLAFMDEVRLRPRRR